MPSFKIDYFNPDGCQYWDGILFKKTFAAHTDVSHPDNNSNAELY